MTHPNTAPTQHPHHRAIVAATTALAVLSLVGTALSPYLLTEHPLLLIGLNPNGRHLLLAANSVEPWQAVLVGSLRRGLSLMSLYALASLYGQAALSWVEDKRPWAGQLFALVERLYDRVGFWLVVLVPSAWVAAFAGVVRLNWRTFLLAIIPGQIAVVFATLTFGEAIGAWTAPLLAIIKTHALEMTVVFVAAVVLQRIASRLQGSQAEPSFAAQPINRFQ